jgi:hypothetical protein
VECDTFQDAGAFMANGGERGPQMSVIPPGTYRINPLIFDIQLADVVDIPDNKIGIATRRNMRSRRCERPCQRNPAGFSSPSISRKRRTPLQGIDAV